MKFIPGQKVVVRPLEEIAKTLDPEGYLEGLPFMPEMIPYCGREFRVFRRSDRTCIDGEDVEIRYLPNTVFLDNLRCSGERHGECQKHCLLFWKEAWLRDHREGETPPKCIHPLPDLPSNTRRDDGRYMCQSTELKRATAPLSRWSRKRIFGEYTVGNVGLGGLVRFLVLPEWFRFKRKLKPRSVRPAGYCTTTPIDVLQLQPGEWVEVKGRMEIEETLDRWGRNRGLEFTLLMVPFCGLRFKVLRRVQRIILETTGEMIEMDNTVILEGATCDGHTFLGGCPRDTFHLWREVWLRRIPSPS